MTDQHKPAFDHSGSSFDSFLEEERILEEVEATAIKRVMEWQRDEAGGDTPLRKDT